MAEKAVRCPSCGQTVRPEVLDRREEPCPHGLPVRFLFALRCPCGRRLTGVRPGVLCEACHPPPPAPPITGQAVNPYQARGLPSLSSMFERRADS
jgi:hypothetical protein